ncbi:Uncharacterised protein [Mycolicibacterium tokaiense]|uniref:Uncharacterized protein n=1 Tax=Mycolicibacterium tokaiense TaxID=39695 RepID=A0A378TRG4_9MYCO|nr:hypothetical protein MTOK_50370 [Mycolicibacterium tokaiense]STZ62355.1 Uncharacterised protein [Mycolicibacterium tokaiense]
MAKTNALDAITRIVAADFYARRQLEETETEGNPAPPVEPAAEQPDTPRSDGTVEGRKSFHRTAKLP